MAELSLQEIDCVADSQVDDPLPFPQPQFKRCAVRQLPIFLREDKIESTMVIHTATNSFYEIGRQLREAIYGQVNHGIILMPRDRSSFQRATPQRHVAIKVSKHHVIITWFIRDVVVTLMHLNTCQIVILCTGV